MLYQRKIYKKKEFCFMKKYLILLIIALLIIIGGGCYLIQALIDTNEHPQWSTFFGNVGSAVLICGLLTLFQNLITKKYDDDNLKHLLGISSSIKHSHLKTILTDSSKYNFGSVITKSADFSVIINDGLRWVGNNSNSLEKRFNRKNTETEFFLVDPNSDFCKALANKTERSVDDLKNKIEQSISQIETTYNKTEKKGSLKIYLLKNYPTQTLFYADDVVIVTPYQTSSGRSVIPLYEYEYNEGDTSIASHLFQDLKLVRKESSLISEDGVRKD